LISDIFFRFYNSKLSLEKSGPCARNLEQENYLICLGNLSLQLNWINWISFRWWCQCDNF